MAIKRQLLVFTRYYKGEEECPAHIKSKPNGEFYWETERLWVNDSLNNNINKEFMIELLKFVEPPVPAEYGIPTSLLAYLFHRISKWDYSPANCGARFRDVVVKEYLH